MIFNAVLLVVSVNAFKTFLTMERRSLPKPRTLSQLRANENTSASNTIVRKIKLNGLDSSLKNISLSPQSYDFYFNTTATIPDENHPSLTDLTMDESIRTSEAWNERVKREVNSILEATRTVEVDDGEDLESERRRDEFLRSINYTDDTSIQQVLSKRSSLTKSTDLNRRSIDSIDVGTSFDEEPSTKNIEKSRKNKAKGPVVWLFEDDEDNPSDDIVLQDFDAPQLSLWKQTTFASYWYNLPNPIAQSFIYPNSITQRLGAIKSLICLSNPQVFGDWSAEVNVHDEFQELRPNNFLWGIVNDFDWMRRTGRFGNLKKPTFWWRLSFLLTVVPLIAYANVSNYTISVLDGKMTAELNSPPVRYLLSLWERAWVYSDDRVTDRILAKVAMHHAQLEDISSYAWDARSKSAEIALSIYEQEFRELSEAEQKVASGWVSFCKIRATARVNESLDAIMKAGIDQISGTSNPPSLMAQYSKTYSRQSSHLGVHYNQSLPNNKDSGRIEPLIYSQNIVDSLNHKNFRRLGSISRSTQLILQSVANRICQTYPGRILFKKILSKSSSKTGYIFAWIGACICLFLPRYNYRKLTFPIGLDNAEHYECDLKYAKSLANFSNEITVHPFHKPLDLPTKPLPLEVCDADVDLVIDGLLISNLESAALEKAKKDSEITRLNNWDEDFET